MWSKIVSSVWVGLWCPLLMASGQSPSSVGSSAAGAVGVGSKKRERMDGDNDVEVIQQQQSPSTRVGKQCYTHDTM